MMRFYYCDAEMLWIAAELYYLSQVSRTCIAGTHVSWSALLPE